MQCHSISTQSPPSVQLSILSLSHSSASSTLLTIHLGAFGQEWRGHCCGCLRRSHLTFHQLPSENQFHWSNRVLASISAYLSLNFSSSSPFVWISAVSLFRELDQQMLASSRGRDWSPTSRSVKRRLPLGRHRVFQGPGSCAPSWESRTCLTFLRCTRKAPSPRNWRLVDWMSADWSANACLCRERSS